MTTATTTYDTVRFEQISLDEVKPGDVIRIPEVVIDGEAASWKMRGYTVDRVEWKAPGVAFIHRASETLKPGDMAFMMVCGERLTAGVLRVKSEPATKAEEATKAVEVEHRETTVTVAGVERVIRTEMGGRVRTVKQLETAHTKAVKAAVIEMRIAAAPDSMPYEMAHGMATRATKFPVCNWDAAVRPLRALRTEDPTAYLVEVEPGHWATEDAAEMLRNEPPSDPVEDEPLSDDARAFLASLLGNVAA
ncbi:hypothetical protein ACFWMJ_23430 [Streptomyces hawaiiensis]|uniref:hypothetical protein n=1 Tax=Streptomyces hawaiiensis TaxID=67305 RepID=UPI003661C1F7